MHGAFLQDCISLPLKYFILKYNLNFYSYILMIESIYIILLKKACLVDLMSWLPKSTILPPSGRLAKLQTHDPRDPQRVLVPCLSG